MGRFLSVLILALTAIQPALTANSGGCSPFSGFYVSGALGWDYYNQRERDQNLVQPELFNLYYYTWAKANSFQGGGFLGWTASFGMAHLGIRAGYQAYARAQIIVKGGPNDENASFFRKMQSVSLDLLPGLRIAPRLLVHGILGVGYGQYRFAAYEFFTAFFRNQKKRAYFPRLGAGVQWAFWRCLTAGFEWTYQFPGNILFPGPLQQFSVQDQSERRVRLFGNQFALTFNYYFY